MVNTKDGRLDQNEEDSGINKVADKDNRWWNWKRGVKGGGKIRFFCYVALRHRLQLSISSSSVMYKITRVTSQYNTWEWCIQHFPHICSIAGIQKQKDKGKNWKKPTGQILPAPGFVMYPRLIFLARYNARYKQNYNTIFNIVSISC